MARLQHSLSSLRRWGCLHATPDALPAAGQALPGRIGYLQGPYERFQRWSLHVILLPQAFLAQTVSPFFPSPFFPSFPCRPPFPSFPGANGVPFFPPFSFFPSPFSFGLLLEKSTDQASAEEAESLARSKGAGQERRK